MPSARVWPLTAMSRKYPLTVGEQSIRLMRSSRKIVLLNDIAADRILHFASVVLPPKRAMSYLMDVFYLMGARAPGSPWRNIMSVSKSLEATSPLETNSTSSAWRELWLKEDYWAIWIGLATVIIACLFFANGSSIRWLAVTPAKWSDLSALGAHFQANYLRYIAQFLVFLVVFTFALTALGHKARAFVPSFTILYLLSLVIFVLGQWDKANTYGFEPPPVALVVGLILTNFARLPRLLDAGVRLECYVKIGIVLLGASLPFTLIIWAGPVAILQASIVSIATFAVIYWVATRLGLDKRLAATLGAGGAVCGVSAAIAIAGAVGAKKEHAPIAITTVIIWAVAMIFVLPQVAYYLHLPAGVGGAWIGTSEFADAAGFAAAEALRRLNGDAAGGNQAGFAYTLIKGVGLA